MRSLFVIGVIIGIVLTILEAVEVISIGWFWATFPFWIVPAVGIGLSIIAVIIVIIFYLIEHFIRSK